MPPRSAATRTEVKPACRQPQHCWSRRAHPLTALISKRYSPTPDHPGIERWYRGLKKPWFMPPDPLMGAGWGVSETALAAGGYRLMRRPSGPARTAPLPFGRSTSPLSPAGPSCSSAIDLLDGSLKDVSVELVAAVAYVAAASRVDPSAAVLGYPSPVWGLRSVLP